MKTSSRWEGAAPRHHWAKLENTTTYSWIPSGPAFVDEGECSERAMRCAVPAGSAKSAPPERLGIGARHWELCLPSETRLKWVNDLEILDHCGRLRPICLGWFQLSTESHRRLLLLDSPHLVIRWPGIWILFPRGSNPDAYTTSASRQLRISFELS